MRMARQDMSGRDLACADLAAAYLHLDEAFRAAAIRADERAEDRRRDRAQAVLGRMWALGCPPPCPAWRGTAAGGHWCARCQAATSASKVDCRR